YGINHREIGGLLLTHWGFPSRLVLCQRSHEFGRSAAGLPPLARICAIASELSGFICQTKTPLPELLVTMEQVFGLSPGLVADAVTLALMKVDSIAEMFEVEIDSEADKLDVMRKAYDSLALLSRKLVEGRRFVCGTPTLAELHDEPADPDVRRALQAVEDEIRNPLTAVGGFARRLAKTIDPTSDQAEYIKIILSETARLEQTLDGTGQALQQ
ncbi:MAG TPA: hypothetical protein DCR97_02215, partial [Deltaproteobacteria bacterium]|nr:hypothetical protein [Deltaproteobacteria bacterium]